MFFKFMFVLKFIKKAIKMSTNLAEEVQKVGSVPDRKYFIDETIADYKFVSNDLEHSCDIYLAYEANSVSEKIKVTIFKLWKR